MSSLFCIIILFWSQVLKGVLNCNYTSLDFYYRAIAARYLRIVYYTSDHSNILTDESLLEIRNIEQQIKSWPGYHNHTLIYGGRSDLYYYYLNPTGKIYCEGAPYSALNYIFPEFLSVESNNYLLFTGDGDTKYVDWQTSLFGSFDNDINLIGQNIWFNTDTFIPDHRYLYISPFLASVYPFAYQNFGEFSQGLDAFVESYDKLLSGISTKTISFHWSYGPSYPDYLNFNEKLFSKIPTPEPTEAPTIADSDGLSRRRNSPCHWFGYNQFTGTSNAEVTYELVIDYPTEAPTPEPTINSLYSSIINCENML